MRRTALILGMAALTAGCSVDFDTSTTGSFTIDLGDFNNQCELDTTVYEVEQAGKTVPAECSVTHSPLATDASICEISAICTGLNLVDTAEINDQIDDATDGNDRVRARIISMRVNLTGAELSVERPDISRFDLGMDSLKDEERLDIFDITLADVERLEGGDVVEVFEGDEDSPFITQINDSIEDGEELPVEGATTIQVPLAAVQKTFVGEDVTATIDYAVDATGRGSLCLLGCGGGSDDDEG